MKKLAIFAVSLLSVYLLGAFAHADFNIFNWYVPIRISISAMGFIAVFVVACDAFSRTDTQ